MCDTLCRLRADRTLFAKSSDRPVGERQLLEVHPARPPGTELRATHITIPDTGAYALLGSRPEWCWGLEHGVNEHRVAIGNEKVWTIDDPHHAAPALIGIDLVRLGLERARSADEAIQVMTQLLDVHGQGGDCEADGEPYWSSFLVADPNRAWVLETSGSTWAARAVDGAAAISNRITLGTDWDRASPDVSVGADFDTWRDPAVPTAIGDLRLALTRPAAATTEEPAELARVLRDHGAAPWGSIGDTTVVPPPPNVADDFTGISVCMHLRDYQTTAASMIAELPELGGEVQRAWVSLSNPCVGVFIPVFPPSLAPAELADPTSWDRFDRLARRVEDDPDALAPIRAVTAPLEAELWQAADDVAGDPRAARAFVEGCWPPVDAALERLGV